MLFNERLKQSFNRADKMNRLNALEIDKQGRDRSRVATRLRLINNWVSLL